MKRRSLVVVLALIVGIVFWKWQQHAQRHADGVRLRRQLPEVGRAREIRPPPPAPAQPARPSSFRDWINRLLFDEQPITGKVVDGEGRPIGGAAVGVVPEGNIFAAFADPSDRPAVTLSAADGSFRIPDVRGDGRQLVWARAPGFAMGEQSALPGERDVTIQLKAQSILRGVVIDDRGVVSAFRLQVVPSKLNDQEMVGRFLMAERPPLATNSNGQFEVTGLSVGTYDVIVETDDKRGGRLSGVSLREGEVRDGIRISVGEGGRITGKVVDYVSGEPVATASVLGRLGDPRTVVRADGTFEISGLPPISLQLMVSDKVYYPDWRWVIVSDLRATIDVGVIRLLRKDDQQGDRSASTGIDPYNLNGRNLVLNVLPDSPAGRAGVQIGDEIQAIDGRDLTGVGSMAVFWLLHGAPDTAVEVSLQSSDGSNRRTLRLVRERPSP
jgi:hypothetical protein